MGRKIGEIYGEIKLKNRDFNNKLNESKRGVKGFKASAMIAFAAISGAAYSLTKGLKKVVGAASDLQEVTAKFKTVFRGSLGPANQTVTELTKNFAMSTKEAREHMAAVQDLLVPMGLARDKAANLSGEIVKLAADLGSFNNLPTAQVMADIESALTGQYRTMRKYGVVLYDTEVRQKALTMGLAATNDELTAGDRAMAAYKMMVEGSQDAIGDMERTSGSYANTLKRTHARIDDLTARIGQDLLPVMTDLLEKTADLTEALTENWETVLKWGNVATWVITPGIRLGNLMSDLRIKLENMITGQETSNAVMDIAKSRMQAYGWATDEAADNQEDLNEETEQTTTDMATMNTGLKTAEENMVKMGKSGTASAHAVYQATDNLKKEALYLTEVFVNLGRTIWDAFNVGSERGVDFWGILKGITGAAVRIGATIAGGPKAGLAAGAALSVFGLQHGGYAAGDFLRRSAPVGLPRISSGWANQPSVLVGEGGEGELVIPESKLKNMFNITVHNANPNTYVEIMANLPEGSKQRFYREVVKPASDRESVRYGS